MGKVKLIIVLYLVQSTKKLTEEILHISLLIN